MALHIDGLTHWPPCSPTTVINVYVSNIGVTPIASPWSVAMSNSIYKLPAIPNTWNIAGPAVSANGNFTADSGPEQWKALAVDGREYNFGVIMASSAPNVTKPVQFFPTSLKINGVACTIPQPCNATIKFGNMWTDTSFGDGVLNTTVMQMQVTNVGAMVVPAPCKLEMYNPAYSLGSDPARFNMWGMKLDSMAGGKLKAIADQEWQALQPMGRPMDFGLILSSTVNVTSLLDFLPQYVKVAGVECALTPCVCGAAGFDAAKCDNMLCP
ncbi:hypothetical protein FOA52_002753 [Chlamydomonas sp. UWO 241]|nr:hypothetical protein FOA52_002753 [Chlamydomonas sp. UWO 241]